MLLYEYKSKLREYYRKEKLYANFIVSLHNTRELCTKIKSKK